MAKKLTQEKLDQIPELLAQGKSALEIAELFGVTVGTLRVVCSRSQISLRKLGIGSRAGRPRLKPKPLEAPLQAKLQFTISLPKITMDELHLHARENGITGHDYVSKLLQIIVADNLYQAVLDE